MVEEYSFDQVDRKFLYANSHVVLYAKGFYKITNIYNDLKKIISISTGKNVDKITNREVFELVLKIFLCLYRRNDPQLLFSVLNVFDSGADSVTHEDVLLRLIRGVSKIQGGFQLQKPNYNILDQPESK